MVNALSDRKANADRNSRVQPQKILAAKHFAFRLEMMMHGVIRTMTYDEKVAIIYDSVIYDSYVLYCF